MKKFLALILAILILCLAACSAKDEATGESTTAEPTTELTTEVPTQETSTEPTSEDLSASKVEGLYVFTMDETSANCLGDDYDWFVKYGVKFALVLTLGETEKAELDVRISSNEELEAALIEKIICESAEAYDISYEDSLAMMLEGFGSEEAMQKGLQDAIARDMDKLHANLIDIYPLSGTYRAEDATVTVAIGGSEIVFRLEGLDLVTEQSRCSMTFVRQQ